MKKNEIDISNNEEYLALIKKLMGSDDNLSKELFFDFFSEYTKPSFKNLWNDDFDRSSFWVLLINGINEKFEVTLVKELLFWKEFFSRETTKIKCFQSSDQQYFNLCIKKFAVTNAPALILSNEENFSDFVLIEKKQLTKMIKNMSFSNILNQIQFKLIKGENLQSIKHQLESGDLLNHFGKIVELKKLLSESRIINVIDHLLKAEEITSNPLIHNEVVNLSSRFKSTQIQKRKGILDGNEFRLEINKISNSLLEIIDYYEIES